MEKETHSLGEFEVEKAIVNLSETVVYMYSDIANHLTSEEITDRVITDLGATLVFVSPSPRMMPGIDTDSAPILAIPFIAKWNHATAKFLPTLTAEFDDN